jgi:carbon-monoxide dehydrogenase medium subunit
MFRNLPKFEFLSPNSIEEAISLLAKHGPEAKLIAGGTDLISEMRWGEWQPQYVVGLGRTFSMMLHAKLYLKRERGSIP